MILTGISMKYNGATCCDYHFKSGQAKALNGRHTVGSDVQGLNAQGLT
jgi:hypothetical protein